MSQESIQRGSTVFSSICQACHQPHGKGMKGSIPPLDGSEWLNAKVKGVPVSILLKGLKGPITVNGETFDSEMPTQGLLSDQQIADVLTYARQQWSNHSSAITAAYVAQVRESIKNRTQPWTAQELKSMVGGRIEKEEQASSPFSSNSIQSAEKTSPVLVKTTIEEAPAESSLLALVIMNLALIRSVKKIIQK